MQIVIDVKEDFLYEIKHKHPNMRTKLEQSVLDGTVLPKGHGDLIDRQALIDNGIEKGFCDWYDEIKYADTIIKADKE